VIFGTATNIPAPTSRNDFHAEGSQILLLGGQRHRLHLRRSLDDESRGHGGFLTATKVLLRPCGSRPKRRVIFW